MEEAYLSGRDYLSFMGTYGVVSSRTCPDCPMMETVWTVLMLRKIPYEALTDRQNEVIQRINGEPENMKTEKNKKSSNKKLFVKIKQK